MPGRLGRTMPARGWPNLVEIAGAALRHYDEICDPDYHYAPYVGASLGWPTPCFNHHRWDWIEVLPYPLIGRIAARRLTGYLGGAEIERRQRQLLLSAFHNLDGFAYPHYVRGWSSASSAIRRRSTAATHPESPSRGTTPATSSTARWAASSGPAPTSTSAGASGS